VQIAVRGTVDLPILLMDAAGAPLAEVAALMRRPLAE
jgi:hypothetical protein